ncbi:MAG: hypothetical protein M3220_00110, partial [Chloroflexota bacterium]|nr:hypothetical protein [Chloroflexota bacterium]
MPAEQVSQRTRPSVPRGNIVAEVCFNTDIRRRVLWILGGLSVLFVLMVGIFTAQGERLPYDEPLTTATQGVREGIARIFFDIVGFVGYSPWNAIVAAALCIGVG